ncbi:MAG: hypothetical protein LC676_08130 [Loktanella sp.]|nr:hypothetical protein [Loktanella sp.]
MPDGVTAGRDRGEVARHGQRGPGKDVGETDVFSPATAADLGVRRDEIHEARAIRRAGELINQIKSARGARTDLGGAPPLSRKQAAADAGMSPDQAKQAQRVGGDRYGQ